MVTGVTIGKGYDSTQERHRDSGRKFDVKNLPADLRRVYKHLEEMYDEEYALTVVFAIRTAIELHRAWHVSLLINKLVQQLKDKFDLCMTWDLGVTDLVFRVEDGMYELHRRVPYDYDSEFQLLYSKTAVALVEGDIGVHDALIFQSELKEGKHTCPNGLLLRSNPVRLILYPFQAATCCVIFFKGDWRDAVLSALCGITAGLVEWAMSSKLLFSSANMKDSKSLIDVMVGLSTGVIGGLFYAYWSDQFCLSAAFCGALYWFFYGTAFVIGVLEIISGELQTGVTRFLGVAIKTFMLSLGSALGLTLVLGNDVYDAWTNPPGSEICDSSFIENKWWRFPLYVLCSVSVLGQYRFVTTLYCAGLIVQCAAYMAQYEYTHSANDRHIYDGMDTVSGDFLGSMVAVATASFIAWTVDSIRYRTRIVHTDVNNGDKKSSLCGKFAQNGCRVIARVGVRLGFGRDLSRRCSEVRAKLEERSKVQRKAKAEIKLDDDEEATLIEAAVEAQEFDVWSLLMPAVYQLVPGSKLAMYWYNTIFPPQRFMDKIVVMYNETDDLSNLLEDDEGTNVTVNSAGNALWLTSGALAMGLLLGLFFVRCFFFVILTVTSPFRNKSKSVDEINEENAFSLRRFERQGITRESNDDDPDGNTDWSADFETKWGGGIRNRKDRTSDPRM